LQNNTISAAFIGQNILILPKISSTNAFLKDNLSNSTPFAEGTAIMAVEQFAGKGQLGATWKAQAGKNLTFSVLLHPTQLSLDDQFLLTQAFSVAVAEALNEFIKPHTVQIKWPNDLYVEDRKLGGILIENSISGNHWKNAIVGIGINVNTPIFDPEIQYKAISIFQLIGHSIELIALLRVICQYLDTYYQRLLQGKTKKIKESYEANLYLKDTIHTFYIDGIPVDGKLIGVSDHGKLLVDFNGYSVPFSAKEIAFFK
jgi:BirA family biotin operon repressor/biotin-[acetyl-CoA-carboxylase] ligase